MAKQMYDNKTYAPVAWDPLIHWVFNDVNADDDVKNLRFVCLTKFTKEDTEFFTVVAQCLWNLANGSNVPWGRGVSRPGFYDSIPAHEKVRVVSNKPRCIFFFVIVNIRSHIWVMPQRDHSVCPYMIPTKCDSHIPSYIRRLGRLHQLFAVCWGNPLL